MSCQFNTNYSGSVNINDNKTNTLNNYVMENSEVDERILEEEKFIKRVECFISQIEIIQERFNYWFESRHGICPSQEHDKIGNHLILDCCYPRSLSFGYWKESELPVHIREECNAIYAELFGTNN